MVLDIVLGLMFFVGGWITMELLFGRFLQGKENVNV